MKMQINLRQYIESLFEDTPPSKNTIELKEEMIQNIQDKYNDLIKDGKSPEAAYNIAIASIGNVGELLKQLEMDANYRENSKEIQAIRQKSALRVAIAVMLYIISLLPIIVISQLAPDYEFLGIVALFVICAAATGLLIYNGMSKPAYLKTEDNVVEDFREWQNETHERRQMRKAISSALWSITTVAYLIVSFTTGAWHITWVAFPLAGAIEALINMFFSMNKSGK